MAEMQFETVIRRPVEDVFALIADLPNYGKWLPPSNIYGGVTQYSELPVRVGTQYVDQGKASRMMGAVTEFEPPTRISFRQTSASLLGGLTIEILYTLAAEDGATRVTRQVSVQPSGAYSLLEPVLLGQIRKESERILAKIKGYLEEGAEE
jgi:uncharacterized protein YndB with AHSA1/START domain